MKSEFSPNSTIILVHAAWADGSCWSKVILPLQQHGLRVICAPIPMTTLSDDAATLSKVLERTSGPVLLVGHAYSGAVIAAVREDRVKALVYIAALAPDEGEPVAKVFYRDEPHPDQPKMVPILISLSGCQKMRFLERLPTRLLPIKQALRLPATAHRGAVRSRAGSKAAMEIETDVVSDR